MVCEALLACYACVQLFVTASVSEAFSLTVSFSKNPLSQSRTSSVFFGRSPLLLCKSSYCPGGKDYLKMLIARWEAPLFYKVHFLLQSTFSSSQVFLIHEGKTRPLFPLLLESHMVDQIQDINHYIFVFLFCIISSRKLRSTISNPRICYKKPSLIVCFYVTRLPL